MLFFSSNSSIYPLGGNSLGGRAAGTGAWLVLTSDTLTSHSASRPARSLSIVGSGELRTAVTQEGSWQVAGDSIEITIADGFATNRLVVARSRDGGLQGRGRGQTDVIVTDSTGALTVRSHTWVVNFEPATCADVPADRLARGMTGQCTGQSLQKKRLR